MLLYNYKIERLKRMMKSMLINILISFLKYKGGLINNVYSIPFEI